MKFSLCLFFTLFIYLSGKADNPPPGFNPGDPSNTVPIDGGIVTLFGAGALYGIKKIRDRKKGKEDPEVLN